MILRIDEIADAGSLEKERIVLRALQDGDLGEYALFAATVGRLTGKVMSGNIPFCYWFRDKEIKKDDLVIVYTKAGKLSEKILRDGASTSHFFYWGLNEPIWPGAVRRLVVVKVASWRSKTAPEADEDK